MVRVLVLLLALAIPAGSSAQTVAIAQISGAVNDASGVRCPASRSPSPRSTPASRARRSRDRVARYVLPNLPPGPYKLEVSLQGFSSYEQTGIVLQVGTSPVINVSLKLGTISETVTVTAGATMIETRNTAVGSVVAQEQIVGLPLDGRQASQLVLLSGAAVTQPGGRSQRRSVGGGHLGRRRHRQQHHLPRRRRVQQRPREQHRPADAVPRRPRGVQGRDRRASGPLRDLHRCDGERRHQGRHEQLPRRRVRVHARSPLQRAQRLRPHRRRTEAPPARRHPGWSPEAELVVLRRLPVFAQPPASDRRTGVRAHRGDALGRLHADRALGGLQQRHRAEPAGALRRQPGEPECLQSIVRDEDRRAAAGAAATPAAVSPTASPTTTTDTRLSAAPTGRPPRSSATSAAITWPTTTARRASTAS